mgnify:CR=1 FL=1
MGNYKLAEAEFKFAKLIWDNEPIASGELVKLSQKEMNWKKSTTYTVLKKLCVKGIFQNKNALVSSIISEEEYMSNQSVDFVEDTFGGSLPKFLTAFMTSKGIDSKQAKELKKLIDEHKED